MSANMEGESSDEDFDHKRKGSRAEPREFAPWPIRLARLIARDCQGPGDYEVIIVIPPLRNRPVRITINKIETISRQDL